MKRRHYSQEEIDTVEQGYIDGLSVIEIAGKLNRTTNSVYQIAKRHGFAEKHRPPDDVPMVRSEEEKDEIIQEAFFRVLQGRRDPMIKRKRQRGRYSGE